jgi:hypothetical protein
MIAAPAHVGCTYSVSFTDDAGKYVTGLFSSLFEDITLVGVTSQWMNDIEATQELVEGVKAVNKVINIRKKPEIEYNPLFTASGEDMEQAIKLDDHGEAAGVQGFSSPYVFVRVQNDQMTGAVFYEEFDLPSFAELRSEEVKIQ